MLRKKILTNTFINTVGKFLSFLLQLFIITFLIKSIGKESYGLLVLALAIVGNTNLLEAGFGLSVTKYVAEYHAKKDNKMMMEIVNTNFLVATVLALIFSLLLVIINEFVIDKIFAIPHESIEEVKNLIRILIGLSIIEFWSASIMRIAEGLQKYMLVRIMELIKWSLRGGFVVFAAMAGYRLEGIGFAYLAAGALSLFIFYVAVFTEKNGLIIGIRFISTKSFKLLFSFSIWIFLSKIFSFFSYRIDTILIGLFLSPVYLTYYNIAFKIYEMMSFGFSVLSYTVVPVTSELNVLVDKKRLNILFQKSTKYLLLTMYPLLTFLLFYSGFIIKLWVGKGFETSVTLCQLFMISLFFTAIGFSGAQIVVGLDRLKELVPYSGLAVLINFTTSLILIQKIGINGVVIGTIIGTIFIMTGYLYYFMKLFDFSITGFLKDILWWPSAIAAILSLFFVITKNFYISIIVLIFTILFVFKFIVDKEDRDAILRFAFLKKSYYQK